MHGSNTFRKTPPNEVMAPKKLGLYMQTCAHQALSMYLFFRKKVVSGRALIGLRSGRPVEICCPLFVLVKSLFDLWIECEGDLGGRQVIFTPFNFGFHHWNIKKGVA